MSKIDYKNIVQNPALYGKRIFIYKEDIFNKDVWYAMCKLAGVNDEMIDNVYLVIDIAQVEARVDLRHFQS